MEKAELKELVKAVNQLVRAQQETNKMLERLVNVVKENKTLN